LLDQLASTGQAITLEMAQAVLGTAASQAVLDVVEALVDGRADTGLDSLHAALDAGSDPRQFARQIVDYLRDLLLVRMGNASQVDATAEVRQQMAHHAQKFSAPELLRLIRAFNHAAGEARSAWQPALPLEMAFVDALEPPQSVESLAPATPPASSGDPPPRRSTSPQQPATPQQHDSVPLDVAPKAQPAPADTGETDPQAGQKLAAAWPQILGLVRQQSQPAYGTLNSSTSRVMHGDHLTLSFASDVLKTKMEKSENLELLRAALQRIFGREIFVRCVVDTARRDTVPPGVDDDGIVAAALRDLGGELVDIN
jgi:DNA polymerase-3 subunit gamma/tau